MKIWLSPDFSRIDFSRACVYQRGLRPQTDERIISGFRRISDMANIPELLDGHVTLEWSVWIGCT